VLVLQLDMMQRGFQVPNGIQSIRDQVLRLSEITKRLMNFARNVSEEFLTEAVNVNKPISDVVAMVQYEFRNEKIEIKTELGPDLPLIQGNGNYLQQVFLNLMINARDAMPSGGTITITSAVEGMHVVVGFADTGCGIPKELQEKIFEPFFTTKSAGKGTGLGLPICRKIIQQHQGKMRVQSAESQGIKFIITLPIRRSAQ
jgi:signal transduction histidine kinase